MTDVRLAHTADLDPATLAAARAMLDTAFDGELTDEDWDHALGGMHALIWEDAELIGHGSVVQRRLLHRGRALRAGYVEAVGVRADRRRRGHAGGLMGALERVIRGGYDLGALASSDAAVEFYAGRAWQRWLGPKSALTPTGTTPTPDGEDLVYVLPVRVPLDVSAELTCDWRDGDLW